MKEKIELNQADMILMLAEKVIFLTEEYQSLHSAFTYDGKGKTLSDPIVIAESYQKFLCEAGDIKRILRFYDLFIADENKPIK